VVYWAILIHEYARLLEHLSVMQTFI